MTIKDMRQKLTELLTPAVGDTEAKAMADTIIMDIKGCSQLDLAINSHRDLLPDTEKRMLDAAQRVINGMPLQYALGVASFHGRMFGVDASTLIPRPETSQLVDIIEKDWQGQSDLRILDIGTGSGCIAISLALDLPFSQVTGIDISDRALIRAQANAKQLKARVEFLKADALHIEQSAVKDKHWNIVVSNPPYVLMSEKATMETRVTEHEPPTALFVPDSDPVKFYKPIAEYAYRTLEPQGMLYLECNPLSIKQVLDTVKQAGFSDPRSLLDYKGKLRFVIVKKD
ncbi:MAG: peptide chain release factor N(5)-glutamine methyltransferase [Bacteroidales bacterium]|nr:peptide chain release factor N(5)-glutamine methyltransferase [Bacteroidales bacterium]